MAIMPFTPSLFFKELLVMRRFQKEPTKARINIKLDIHTGGAQKKVELPLKYKLSPYGPRYTAMGGSVLEATE